jgi:IS30 family transposase
MLWGQKVPLNKGRQLGRHRSTIYGEISTFHDRELSEYDGYYSTVADDITPRNAAVG